MDILGKISKLKTYNFFSGCSRNVFNIMLFNLEQKHAKLIVVQNAKFINRMAKCTIFTNSRSRASLSVSTLTNSK